MADFFSERFSKNIWITNHARASMLRREIGETTLWEIIETGEIRRRNEIDIWVFKRIAGRADNLICAAIVEKVAIVIKTVMINWELEDEV